MPSAVWGKRFAPLNESDLPADDFMKLAPASMRARWDKRQADIIKASSPDDFAFRQLLYDKSRELIAAMIRAGVPMVAGTDAMDGYVLPGASLYEELSLFLEAGMSPMAALQSATINAAKFMGRQDSLGTIEVGKIADLVLLDADPLQAIENTRRIHTVIVDGKLFSPSRRQAMIAKMEAYAKAH